MVDNKEQELDTPAIMQGDKTAVAVIQEYRDDIIKNRAQLDTTKFAVMEGMQNEEKVPFFTEFENFDDVLRMNTIEAFVDLAPKVVKKTSDKNRDKIALLLQNTYINHVKTHKRNMVSNGRKRENAYVKILSNDTTEPLPQTGFKKFFGIGGNNKWM